MKEKGTMWQSLIATSLKAMLKFCGVMAVAARPTFILAMKNASGKWCKREADIRDLRVSKYVRATTAPHRHLLKCLPPHLINKMY